MMRFLDIFLKFVGSFRAARRGAVATLFAVLIVPMILAAGAAVDFGRLEVLRSSLQSVVDGAALAGASALNRSSASSDAITIATDYFTKGAALIASDAVISSPKVSEPSDIKVTVVATATLNNTLMSLVAKATKITVTASAEGPSYQLSVTKTGGFKTNAYDSNSIYFFDATTSTSATPRVSAMTLLFTNDSSVGSTSTSTQTIGISANDNVGFALVNKTGGLTDYGTNGYGSASGKTHKFYSSLTTPSSSAYSADQQGKFYTGRSSYSNHTSTCTKTAITGTNNSPVTVASNSCNAHPCTTLDNNGAVLENNLLIAGSCSTQATATQTCLSLNKTALAFAWGDMGGGSDDFDYDDATYTVSCKPTASTENQSAVVVLVQ
ncbi:MAG: TadE/TadG family type IV pilus assembly protein [Janthinobacterium lividum]